MTDPQPSKNPNPLRDIGVIIAIIGGLFGFIGTLCTIIIPLLVREPPGAIVQVTAQALQTQGAFTAVALQMTLEAQFTETPTQTDLPTVVMISTDTLTVAPTSTATDTPTLTLTPSDTPSATDSTMYTTIPSATSAPTLTRTVTLSCPAIENVPFVVERRADIIMVCAITHADLGQVFIELDDTRPRLGDMFNGNLEVDAGYCFCIGPMNSPSRSPTECADLAYWPNRTVELNDWGNAQFTVEWQNNRLRYGIDICLYGAKTLSAGRTKRRGGNRG